MAKHTISISLSEKSIQNAIKELESYNSSLINKCETFVRKLAEKGIETAKTRTGNYGKYITFTIKTNKDEYGVSAVLLATNTGIIRSEWLTKDGVKTADVSPLLMVEFGSGLRAKNPKNVPGVGTGTFPGGTHGSTPNGWWYKDLDSVWHHSTGVSPQAPVYNASLRMISDIQTVAREVFG